MLLNSGDGASLDEMTLRRSGGGRDGVLHGRNRECCSCFGDLQGICQRLLIPAV